MTEKILELKKSLGNKVFLPVHHYQRHEIVAAADLVGDSYKLAVEVSKSKAEYIVFCGVKFMAEGAAVLAQPHQKVIMPNTAAGCPMADMISGEQAEEALEKIAKLTGLTPAPVVYMNAYADMKAVCGRHGGSVCTSSNAELIITHYLKRNQPIFFTPDYCLGANTAKDLGIPDDKTAVISRSGAIECSGNPEETLIFLWDGNCRVHQRFTTDQIAQIRETHPSITVIVHPEVQPAVAQQADLSGSTQKIYQIIRDAKPGTVWGVGTEYNFVSRIAAEFSDKEIYPIFDSHCMNMERTTPEHLIAVLSSLKRGTITTEFPDNFITVSDEVKIDAAKSLNTMISIVQKGV